MRLYSQGMPFLNSPAATYGDRYARLMSERGGAQFKYYVQAYGHPFKFGFVKNVIATWKADQFEPDALMDLYRKAGAKYFVSIGVHCDNFDLWNSVQALKQGLRFGVSEHLSNGYNRLATSHRSDREGPYAGVPCDGADPRYADPCRDASKQCWFLRIQGPGGQIRAGFALHGWRHSF